MNFRRFLFDQPMPEYIDAYYLPPPDAELVARNQARADEAKVKLGERYCLHNKRITKRSK